MSLYEDAVKRELKIKQYAMPETAILECKLHGSYEGHRTKIEGRTVESVCPSCLEEEARRDRAELFKTNKLNVARTIFNRSCIPKRYQSRGMNTYVPDCPAAERIKKILTSYIQNIDRAMESGTSFLFTGGPGTGKTHLANAIAMNAISLGRTAMYISAVDCIAKVKKSWLRNSEESEDCMIDKFSKFYLLIIDEIGLGMITEKEKSIIFRVVNRRYEEELPTIGISKFNRARLQKMVGEELVSRLESGGGGNLMFNWKDYRLKNSINK
ncbi:MAG: ATP-binding protein [Gammaproteobacteria bacterium]|nr:ATP-binding protein [Gammaproteobacteria bacterium]